jgi:hypothetical protein
VFPCLNYMMTAVFLKTICCCLPLQTGYFLQHDAHACRSSCLRCSRGSLSGAPFRPPLLLAAIFKEFQLLSRNA